MQLFTYFFKLNLTDINPLLCWIPQTYNVQNIYHEPQMYC
jgi:hypothetical protein